MRLFRLFMFQSVLQLSVITRVPAAGLWFQIVIIRRGGRPLMSVLLSDFGKFNSST